MSLGRCARRAPSVWRLRLAGLVIAAACFYASITTAGAAPRVATVDWAQAETLTALGVPPAGVGQLDAYRAWVGGGELPASTRDIGLRAQPNMELLAQMDLDVFTVSPMFAAAGARIEKLVRVEDIPLYHRDGPLWPNLAAATRALGAVVKREAAAERLIAATDARLEALAAQLPAHTPPLLLAQFVDTRHVRVFGGRGLYPAVLERLGLDNAWTGRTSFWGYALVPLERLGEIERAQIVIVEPLPVGVERVIAESVLWRRLPAVRAHPVLRLPPAWSFGGLPSAVRFAESLVAALDEAAPRTRNASCGLCR